MKKLIALISAIAVIGTMSLTSFAEITVTPNPELTTAVTLEKGESGGYDASYTSDDVNTQTTIVAVKGATIDTNSIQYINQLAQDSEIVINFDLKDTLAVGETVTVYMGGDKIAKTEIGTITNVPEAPEYTLGDVDGDGTIDPADAGWALSKYTNSSTVLPGGDLAADVDGDGTIDPADAGWILSKYTNSSTVFPAETK